MKVPHGKVVIVRILWTLLFSIIWLFGTAFFFFWIVPELDFVMQLLTNIPTDVYEVWETSFFLGIFSILTIGFFWALGLFD